MQFIPAVMATLAIILMFTAAQAETPAQPTSDVITEQLSATADQLALRDDQRAAFTAILTDQWAAQRDLLQSFGIDTAAPAEGIAALGWGDKRRLRAAMQSLRDETTDALSEVLDAEQLATFQAIQAEREAARREAMRARLRGQI